MEGQNNSITLFGRCKMHRVGVYYSAPTGPEYFRGVAVLIELPRSVSPWNHLNVVIVRHVACSAHNQGRTLAESDVLRFCSCCSVGTRTIRSHLAICDSNGEIVRSVFSILSMTHCVLLDLTNHSSWRAIVVGDRSTGTTAIWMAVCTDEWNMGMINFVPVIENRSTRSSRILTRLLRCAACRRSNDNRWACEHEDIVAGEIRSLANEDRCAIFE